MLNTADRRIIVLELTVFFQRSPIMSLQAIYIRSLVWCHLTRRDVQARESNAARSLQRLGRTAFWLLMSSLAITFSLISNVLVLLTPMTILENVPELAVSPITYCILVASTVFFRVSISYTQARQLLPL